MNIDTATGLYFYSALLQADAAILAIIGLFVTFKLQTIQLIINNLRERITALLYSEENPRERIRMLGIIKNFDESSLREKSEFAERHKQEQAGSLSYLIDEIPYNEKMEILKKGFIAPSYFIAILISLCIVGIILASTIHSLSCLLEVTTFCFVGFLHILMFFSVVQRIKSIIKG